MAICLGSINKHIFTIVHLGVSYTHTHFFDKTIELTRHVNILGFLRIKGKYIVFITTILRQKILRHETFLLHVTLEAEKNNIEEQKYFHSSKVNINALLQF